MDSFELKLTLLKDLYRPSIDKQALLRACFIKDEQEILDSMTHLQLVTYAYKCSSSVVKLIKDKETLQKTNECLDLVNQWIGSHYNNKNKKPSNNALTKAAHAAYSSTYAAAARSAAHAANAAANAACSAANAADAAYHAANAAAYAADAAHDAGNYNKAKHKQVQLNFKYLIETLKS